MKLDVQRLLAILLAILCVSCSPDNDSESQMAIAAISAGGLQLHLPDGGHRIQVEHGIDSSVLELSLSICETIHVTIDVRRSNAEQLFSGSQGEALRNSLFTDSSRPNSYVFLTGREFDQSIFVRVMFDSNDEQCARNYIEAYLFPVEEVSM